MKSKIKEAILENPQPEGEMSNQYLKKIADLVGASKKTVHGTYTRMVKSGMVEPLMNLAVNQMSDKELIESNVRYKKETHVLSN